MDQQGSQELDFSGRFLLRVSEIPHGIKLLTLSRTIRWFGWGFGETLIPVFIISFSSSFTGAGVISSSLDFVFLLALPFVGVLADAISSKALLVVGVVLYMFIGVSYYLAGVTGLILFLMLPRIINGVSYCIDTVGTDTYIRRMAPRHLVASAFGFMASWANFGWLVSALVGVYLVQFIPVGVLLFAITPFSIIGLWPLLKIERDKPIAPSRISLRKIATPLVTFLKEIAAMKKGLRSVVFLMFILDFASVMATFFIPIDAYRSGASLSAVALLVAIGTAPTLAEFWLAEFIDGSKVKRKWALFVSLAALPLLFVGAAVASAFSARIIVALGIEVAAVFGSLALQSYATMLSRRERYGEISSVLEGASGFGNLVGPVAIGLLADAAGFPLMFALSACGFFLIALYFLRHPIER